VRDSAAAAWSVASFDFHRGVLPVVAEASEQPQPLKRSQIIANAAAEVRSAAAADSGDDLSNLRKLLKEGRIAGLNERPPAFKPPSPPTAKPGKEKPRPTATTEKQTRQDKRPTGEAGEKRGKRVAPPPPESGKEVLDGGRKVRGGGDGDVDLKPPAPAGGVKFLGGRRVHSVENLCGRGGEVGRDPGLVADQPTDPLKRSTSMHTHQDAGGRAKTPKDSGVAQLIADSTEKKFRLNSLFKGIWKKKQYSYEFG